MKPVGKRAAGRDVLGRDRSRLDAGGCVDPRRAIRRRMKTINQGGHEVHALFTALLPDDWRAVADIDQLASLTYRIAWSETFAQAVNSEVPRNAFLSRNWKGFSLNFASLSYQNYFTATTANSGDTSVTLRSAPEVQV